MRKTIEVNEIRKAVNHANEHARDDDIGAQGFRCGHNALLELVLHKTGNYNGYGYAPGYGPFDGPAEHGIPNPNHDDTRRIYY